MRKRVTESRVGASAGRSGDLYGLKEQNRSRVATTSRLSRNTSEKPVIECPSPEETVGKSKKSAQTKRQFPVEN